MKKSAISRTTIGRLPLYLDYLKALPKETNNISSTAIAKGLNLGEIQVRKDLSSISGNGKPKTGYETQKLISNLENFLGYNKKNTAVIIGAGKLGRALLDYSGFEDFGITVAAAFDTAVKTEEQNDSNKNIYPMESFGDFCKNQNVSVGIITVPKSSAQEACNILVQNGIKTILSFAPKELTVPSDIFVKYEDVALSLAHLSKQISKDK